MGFGMDCECVAERVHVSALLQEVWGIALRSSLSFRSSQFTALGKYSISGVFLDDAAEIKQRETEEKRKDSTGVLVSDGLLTTNNLINK